MSSAEGGLALALRPLGADDPETDRGLHVPPTSPRCARPRRLGARERNGIRVLRLTLGRTELAVVGEPLASAPPELTEAEREVLRRILRGESNAEIAAARQTSLRTVANQVGAIFRKLGVSSRGELAARCGQVEPP